MNCVFSLKSLGTIHIALWWKCVSFRSVCCFVQKRWKPTRCVNLCECYFYEKLNNELIYWLIENSIDLYAKKCLYKSMVMTENVLKHFDCNKYAINKYIQCVCDVWCISHVFSMFSITFVMLMNIFWFCD